MMGAAIFSYADHKEVAGVFFFTTIEKRMNVGRTKGGCGGSERVRAGPEKLIIIFTWPRIRINSNIYNSSEGGGRW